MIESTALLFDEYATAYRRGDAPDVRHYLERAGDDADTLADLIDLFIQAMPARQPAEEEVVLSHARLEKEPALLVLRKRRRLTRDAVVGALINALGLDAAKRGKVKGYYADLEVGVLDPKPIDRTVWDALAGIMNANVRVLAGLRPPPPAAPAAAYTRMASGIELHERLFSAAPAVLASMEEAPDDESDSRDEIDRLFTGNA